MPKATEKKAKRLVQVIQEGWYSSGVGRRMGEVLPASGVNVGLMKRQGFIADIEDDDLPNIRECDVPGCATAMVHDRFDEELVGHRPNLGGRQPEQEMVPVMNAVEVMKPREGAGPRQFITQDALESHKMQDHGEQPAAFAPPSSPDPGKQDTSAAAQEAARQMEPPVRVV